MTGFQLKNSLVDVIIVNFNSTDFLLQCLRSLYRVAGDVTLRVIVQDNGSEDGIERVAEAFPDVELIENGRNLGFAAAVNQSLAESDAPHVMLLNPDTIVGEGVFGTLISYLEENRDVGVTGPRILNMDGSVQGSARGFPTALTSIFGRKSPLSALFPNNPVTAKNILTLKNDGKSPQVVDWVSGACMVVRKEAIDQVGPLDERFFVYWEDADWCKRMKQQGWKTVYLPTARVWHSVGQSSNIKPYFSIYHFHLSCYRLFNKYAKGFKEFFCFLAVAGLSARCVFVMFLHVIHGKSKAGR